MLFFFCYKGCKVFLAIQKKKQIRPGITLGFKKGGLFKAFRRKVTTSFCWRYSMHNQKGCIFLNLLYTLTF
ncbi:hypothetical protein HanPI659440_Chr12g0449361 [Helianthus annuus]|nr:hypothetical protein HanPI659440_Chr12g0449361 [Helianthus annuus]